MYFHRRITSIEGRVRQGSMNGFKLAETPVSAVDSLSPSPMQRQTSPMEPGRSNATNATVPAAGAGVGPIDLAPQTRHIDDRGSQECLAEISNLRERLGRLEALMLRTAKSQCLILEKLSASPPKLLETEAISMIPPASFTTKGARDVRSGGRPPPGGAPSSSWMLRGCSELSSAQRPASVI